MNSVNPTTHDPQAGETDHAWLTVSSETNGRRVRSRNRRDLRRGCRRGRKGRKRSLREVRARRRRGDLGTGIDMDRRQRRGRRGTFGFDPDAFDREMPQENARKHPAEDIQTTEAEKGNQHRRCKDAKPQCNKLVRPRFRRRLPGGGAGFTRAARLRRGGTICGGGLSLRRLRLDAGLAWLRFALRIGGWIIGGHGFRGESKLHHAPVSVNEMKPARRRYPRPAGTIDRNRPRPKPKCHFNNKTKP